MCRLTSSCFVVAIKTISEKFPGLVKLSRRHRKYSNGFVAGVSQEVALVILVVEFVHKGLEVFLWKSRRNWNCGCLQLSRVDCLLVQRLELGDASVLFFLGGTVEVYPTLLWKILNPSYVPTG